MSPKILLLSLVLVVVSTAMWKLATVGASEPPISPQTVAFTLVSQSDPNIYPRSAVYRTRFSFAEQADPTLLGLHNGVWLLLWEQPDKSQFEFKLSQALDQQFQGLKALNPGYLPTAIRRVHSLYREDEPNTELTSVDLINYLGCAEQLDLLMPDVCDVTITWDQPINGLGDLPATIAPVEIQYID